MTQTWSRMKDRNSDSHVLIAPLVTLTEEAFLDEGWNVINKQEKSSFHLPEHS